MCGPNSNELLWPILDKTRVDTSVAVVVHVRNLRIDGSRRSLK